MSRIYEVVQFRVVILRKGDIVDLNELEHDRVWLASLSGQKAEETWEQLKPPQGTIFLGLDTDAELCPVKLTDDLLVIIYTEALGQHSFQTDPDSVGGNSCIGWEIYNVGVHEVLDCKGERIRALSASKAAERFGLHNRQLIGRTSRLWGFYWTALFYILYSTSYDGECEAEWGMVDILDLDKLGKEMDK